MVVATAFVSMCCCLENAYCWCCTNNDGYFVLYQVGQKDAFLLSSCCYCC